MTEKKIYSIDPATLGQVKTVSADYKINTIYETEQEPLKDALILAWDGKSRAWYDAGSNTDVRITNNEMASVELFEMALEQQMLIDDLQEKYNKLLEKVGGSK